VLSRRFVTIKSRRSTAADFQKSFELEQRLSRLEIVLQDLTDELALERRRNLALQAQFDHFIAKLTPRYQPG
jgi:hypothetical protein